MNRLLFVICVVCFSVKDTFSQQNGVDLSARLIDELNWYIDTTKSNSNDYLNQFAVYVAYIYKSDSLKHGLCYTFGHIMNSYEYRSVDSDYYISLGKEKVLIKLGDGFEKEKLWNLELKLIHTGNVRIVQKLFPGVLGGITGVSSGMVGCIDSTIHDRTFYYNSDDIPQDKSIYRQPISRGRLELIKD